MIGLYKFTEKTGFAKSVRQSDLWSSVVSQRKLEAGVNRLLLESYGLLSGYGSVAH